MSRRLDADFLIAVALRRVRRGGVARVDGQWFYRGRPMPPGLLRDVYDLLFDEGLIEASEPDQWGTARVTLTLEGQSRYAGLVLAQAADPTVLPPLTVEPDPEIPAGHRPSAAPLAPPGDRPDPSGAER